MKRMLLVVDMQNDFIDGSLGSIHAQAVVTPVREKIKQYHENGETIIFTRDTHGKDYHETQEGRRLPVSHCIIDTDGWQIAEGLLFEDAFIWDKPTFGSPELAIYIKEQITADEIEIVGLCTDICVVSNALILKAFLPEITITVDARCCAGVTEESHQAALLTMKMCQVNVVSE